MVGLQLATIRTISNFLEYLLQTLVWKVALTWLYDVQLLRTVVIMRSDFTQAYMNRDDILMRLNRSVRHLVFNTTITTTRTASPRVNKCSGVRLSFWMSPFKYFLHKFTLYPVITSEAAMVTDYGWHRRTVMPVGESNLKAWISLILTQINEHAWELKQGHDGNLFK